MGINLTGAFLPSTQPGAQPAAEPAAAAPAGVEPAAQPAPVMAQAMSVVQRPMGMLDRHVWNAVARDATNPGAQQVALTVLAALNGGTLPPQAIAGATMLAAPGAPGAPVTNLPAVAGPAGPGVAPAVAPATGPAPAAAQSSPQAAEVARLVNEARAAKGLAPLTLDPKLVQVAAGHSTQMAGKAKMAHEGIGDGAPRERILAAAPKAARTAENVAMGQQTPAEVMQGWMDSPPHRKNILDPKLTRIGVEVVNGPDGRPYWTQVFTG